MSQNDFNSASDMNDIYRNMEKLHKKLKDLGVDLDDIDDQKQTKKKKIIEQKGIWKKMLSTLDRLEEICV